MNKNLFRIIFNKRRGQLMAVAETSSSQGKGSRGEAVTSGHPAKADDATVAISALSFSVLCALGAVLWALPTPDAHAQVVAYRNAPGNQQPTVLQTANGVPQIDIQTPSAAGVSRNVYSQFDVQSNGAILNNSRTSVQTQQGGWIQGNPWLATGSARVILNEVNSSNPSYLNGYVEVAGQRAEVVIANPSGISVNGGGFINTSKATLTTGTPVVNNGNIDSYRVQGGNISINGKGLDLSTTDYSAILARAVQVNAGIWANELKVVTGANQIDAATLGTNTTPATTTIAGTGAVPSFALDVAQIGGMYAGKIHLIGTEQGLGVRSAGTIGSTGGDLVLQNNGWLTTTGTLQASANLQITAQGNITNSGTLYASNDQALSATGNVANSGVIAAQGNTSITANSLSSTSASVVGAGIKTDGTLVGNGNLNVTTTQDLAANGQNLAADNIALTGSSVDLSGSQTGAANIAITANLGNVNTANATVATSGMAGVLNITAKTNNDQTLDNTHGVLNAGQLNLDVANLTNAQGQITQTGVGNTSIILTSPNSTFNNTGGTLAVNSANLEVAANTFTNTDGKIQHAGTGALSITADTLSSVKGQVASNNNVALTIGTQLNNMDGVISAVKDLNLSAGFAVAQQSVSTELNNTRGLIQATAGSLNLNVGNLDNTQGSVYAHADLSLASTGAITNTGFIAAQGNATLSANSLNSSSTSVLGAGVKSDGTLANSGDLKITTAQALSANGQNLAAGNTTLSGSSVNLSGSQTGAANIGITATSGYVNTSNATVATAGTLGITAKTNNSQTLNNFKGILSAKQLNLDVANLNNTQGQITQTGAGNTTIALTSATSTLNNAGGTIATNSANLNLSAGTLTNTDGKIQHAGTGTLSIAANSLTNLRGQIVGNQNTTLQLASLDNTQGSVYASKYLSVTATGAISNTGMMAAQGNATLSANSLSSSSTSILGAGIKADGTLTNSGDLKITTTQTLSANGQNLAAGNMTISGSSVNLSGSQTGAANIDITTTSGDVNTSSATVATSGTSGLLHIVAQANTNNAQTLNNKQGVLSAGQINLEVSKLDNTQATIVAGYGDLSVTTHAFDNTDGKLQSVGSGNLSVAADALTNLRGQVFSNQTATLQLASLDNTQGSVYASKNLSITATDAVTNTGFIAAQGNVTLSANSLSSSSTGVLGAGIKADGTLANSGDLKITTTQALNANGQNLAASNITLSGSSVNVSGSQTGAANICITATSGDVNTSNATVATSGTLSIAAKTNDSQTLNNFKGILSAKQLNLDVANLNNTQGQITQTGTGDTTIALTSVTSTLNNTGGTIATNSANLNLKADTFTNTDGKIQHAGTDTLSIAANSLTNLRGQIVGNQNTTLQIASLDNTQGSVYASKDLSVAATGAITNTGFIAAQGNTTLIANSLSSNAVGVLGAGIKADGTLANSGDLNITTTQALNANGQNLAAGNATLSGSSVNLSGSQTGAANIGITATLGDVNTSSATVATSGTTGLLHIVAQANANNAQILNNKQGVLSAGQINLEVSKLDNTQATIVAGHGDLSVTTHAFDNTDGKLQSIGSGNLSVVADALTNLRGQVFSNQTATLQLASLDNTQGSVYASKNLSLTATDAVTNTGFIAAQGNTSITANSLSSSSTSVLGAGVKTDGTLATSGNLSVITAQALSANGQNLAAGNTTLSGSSVNLSGSQTGAANIGITATSGDVNTSNATVATAGTLSIAAKTNNTQTLNNTQGVLSAGQLNVDVANFNNTHGQAIQTGTGDNSIVLASPTGTLNNTNGTIATNSANLSLSADTLTNTDGKIQHAGTGTLHVTANTLNDQRGQMVSNNALVIDVGTVDHRSASTAAKNITLNATSLNNTEGDMVQTGDGVMTIATTQGLDNTAGKLASNGNLTVSAQSLTNNQGQVSALGDLTVSINTTRTAGAPQNEGVLSNLQGLVAAKGNVAITAASVDNTLGTLASVDKNLNITSTGTTLNDSGKIQAALDITLINAGLSNTRTTNALATSTTPYGSIIGRNVGINTNTQALNNEGGTIVANQSVNLQTGAVNNKGGLVQAGSDLTINTHGLALTNTHAANYTSSNSALNGKGGIAAQGTSSLTTGDLNNDAGYIGSKGALTATAANISNQAGQIQGLNNLTLTAGNGSSTGTINNTGGLIRSDATTSLSAGTITNSNTSGSGLGIEGLDVSVSTTTLRNDSGAIRADNNITVTSAGTVNNSAGLVSAGNTLTLQDVQAPSNRTLAITNTNGTLLTGQSLVVAANSIGGDGSILSKGNLNLALNADFANSGQVIANGNATINTTGNVSNSGKLQAGNTLNLTANNIDNTATGEISANTTQVNASNTLTNRGLIDGVDTRINANTVNNIGTGRIYGDYLNIATVNLTNDTETIGGVTKAGTIAARDRLDLGISGTLTNREHALIYSVGDMAIGGALDANRRATGAATALNNNSATIEAGRNLSLSSATVNNTNDHFAYEIRVATTELDVREDIDSGLYRVFTRTTSLPYQTASDPAQILAGGDLNLNSSNATNYASHIVAGGALNIGSSTLANTDVMATKSIRDVGTTYTLVHVPGSGICGKISINCVHAHDEWQTAPYDSTADSTVSVAQETAASNSGAQVTNLASGAVNQTVGSIGSSTARSGSVSSSQVSVPQSGATQADAASGASASSSVSAVSSSAATTDSISSASNKNVEKLSSANGASASSSVSAVSSSAVTTNSISSASNTNVEKLSSANGASASSNTASAKSTETSLVVRVAKANTTLPTSSLYKDNPLLTSAYLIETDTRFIDRKTWLGSDYMTQSLSLDPTVTQKRLGDGFYEQKLIREQVAQLTGRRFLADYTSDEQEYKALMNSAITFGQKYNLRPGIALTAQQVAQLTSDIVWLVEQTVTLPDGSSQKVLVPQLYVKVQQGDLDGSGALLAGKDVNLNLSGDLTNSGTIAGRNVVSLTAENVNNLGGRIGGTDVSMAAREDLNNIGGSISAVNSLSATAGRDLNIQTTTQTTATQTGIANNSRTGVDRVAGLYVSGANGTLVASAGRDLNIVAGVVSNAGSGTTSLSAGNNFTLASVKTGEQNSITWNADNHLNYGNTQTVGSTINGGGNVNLKAGNDLTATAANVQATQALTANAGGSVNILAGENTTNLDEAHKTSSGGGFFGGATLVTRNVSNTSTAVASNFGGGTVDIATNTKDINVKGSNVASDSGTTLTAGGNVNIEAATNTSQQSSYSQETKSGFSISSIGANPIGVSYSKTKQSDDNQSNSTTAAASTVGSVGGNVNITAGNQYKQVGSDVLTPTGDINITAKTVDIQEARETSKQSTEQKFEQTSISVGLKGGIIDSVQAATQAVEAAKDSSSNRNRNLNALIAYAKASDAYEQGKAVQDAYDKNGVMGGTNADGTAAPGAAASSGIKVSVSIGTSKSQSNSSTTSDTAAGSTVKAGGNVSIKATGQGETEGNLTVQGSNVSAVKDVSLSATKDVNILASADTESNRSSNSSSSTSVGVSVGIGSGGAGLSLDLAASRGKGQANSDSTTYNNSHITGGNAVNVTSGADTNVVGGNIKATQVTADVGGNLNVQSLQDKAVSEASQKTTGIALSIPIVGTGGSASFSQSKQNSNSNYASVNEQSGIQAGDGGFQVNVKGNTDLKGATIASSDKATQDGKNNLTTNTLTTSDLSNSMSASASSSGVSVGTNMMDGKYAMGKAVAGNLLNNGSANQSDASTTTSAISAGNITVGGKTTDTSKATLTDSNGKTVSTDTSNTSRALAKADVAGLQQSAQDQQAANILAFKAATAIADDGLKKMSKPQLRQVFCVAEPCSNDQVTNYAKLVAIADKLMTDNPDMTKDQAATLALAAVVGKDNDPAKADPKYSGSDPNREVKVETDDTTVKVRNIQTVPVTLESLQNLPNDQKVNSTAFNNGIMNNEQRAAELAIQQAPKLDPKDPAQKQQIESTGTVLQGNVYLIHTDKSNNSLGELVNAGVAKVAEILGIPTPAAELKAQVLQALSTNNATGKTDNSVYSIDHSRGTMDGTNAYGVLGEKDFYNPNLKIIENNPAAKESRIMQNAGQIAEPNNIQIYAPRNDPVPALTGGYGEGNTLDSLKQLPSVIGTSNSIHSSPGSGAVGSNSADVNQPFSYQGLDVNQLNQVKQPQTNTIVEQVLTNPKSVQIAPSTDLTTKLQEQVQKDSNAQMNQLLTTPAVPSTSSLPAMQVPNSRLEQLNQFKAGE